MASAARFTLYPCSFVYAGPTTCNLVQMQNFTVSPNANIARIIPAGALDSGANIAVSADPMITFATRDLATIFAVISPTVGIALASGGATFRLQERTDNGTFETGTTHETFTVTQGLIVPTTISANQDDAAGAVLNMSLFCTYDGTNNPIVHNTSVDFSGAPSPAFTSAFYLGPVYHNSSEIAGVVSSSVDFGIDVSVRRTSGMVYATTLAIVARRPVFRFTILKVDAVSALNKFNRALSGTLAFYYRKGTASGTRVADATTSHAKISCSAGSWNEEDITAQENDDGTVTISAMPTSTVAISVASAIP